MLLNEKLLLRLEALTAKIEERGQAVNKDTSLAASRSSPSAPLRQ